MHYSSLLCLEDFPVRAQEVFHLVMCLICLILVVLHLYRCISVHLVSVCSNVSSELLSIILGCLHHCVDYTTLLSNKLHVVVVSPDTLSILLHLFHAFPD